MREHRQYIGGEWVSSGSLFDDLDPYLGTVMADIPAALRYCACRRVGRWSRLRSDRFLPWLGEVTG